MITLTERPLPADVDLRDFAFMPLEVARLRDSEMAAVADAEIFRCGVLLWCYAWHQVPAGSVPLAVLVFKSRSALSSTSTKNT